MSTTLTNDNLADIEEEDTCSLADGDDNSATNKKEEDPEEKIAKRETRAVTSLRAGLLFALISATLIVSLSVYFYTRNQEEKAFEDAFNDSSLKLVETFQAAAVRRLSAIASFGATITSYALATNATWPFVTIPQMEARSSHVLSLAEATSLSFAPIIEGKDRTKWENEYVPEHIRWADESFDYYEYLTGDTSATRAPRDNGGEADEEDTAGPPPTYEGMPDFSKGYSKEIYTMGPTPLGSFGPMVSPGNGPFLSWWQRAPLPRNRGYALINMDLTSDPSFDGDLLEVLRRKKAALGKMVFGGYGRAATGPTSGFYYPVLKDLMDSDEVPVVATIATIVMWDKFFVNVLPQNVNGLVTVLKNTCGQAFTFQINGPNAEFIGEGDLHDPVYDGMQEEVSFTTLFNDGVESETYLGVPLDEEGCQYTLSIYASSEMEGQYISNMPIVYLVGSILIFVFTSLVFVFYDQLVERRQRLVMREAKKSGAIVSSLFPAAYRDRLMEAQEAELEESKSLKNQSAEAKGSLLNSFMKGEDHISNSIGNEQPIADLYQDCTVFFADIAGFTKWSSTRDPGQVFTLLQTVYGVFDKIARKRKVFKVETIGDCYMAVTGLPDPQADHALVMAKFAYDCSMKMHETTRNLADKLGEGTEDLALRIGLHSGSVTAGILRGEKSRFQLFGDTVNTASRMESTGQRNRIQVSASTADLLKRSGKNHWLVSREELIEAKGKGQMQTYWLIPDRSYSTVTDAVPMICRNPSMLKASSSTAMDSHLLEVKMSSATSSHGQDDDFENRLMTRMSR